MGIRSQVVIVVKAGPLRDALAANPGPVLEEADTVEANEEGTLWDFDSIKWYGDSDPDISALLERFQGHEEEVLVVTANEDYPTNDYYDMGEWEDNPWGVRKCIRATVEWDSVKDSHTPPPTPYRVRIKSCLSVATTSHSIPEWHEEDHQWRCLFKSEGSIMGEAYYDYELETWTITEDSCE